MATHNGNFWIDRQIFEDEFWQKKNQVFVWVYLCGHTAFAPYTQNGIHLEKGEGTFTYPELAHACGITERQARSIISALKMSGRLSVRHTNRCSIYKVNIPFDSEKNVSQYGRRNVSQNPEKCQSEENPILIYINNKEEEDGQSPKSSSSHPPKSDGSASAHEICSQAIAYLNEQAGKKFLPKAKKTQQLISARLSEGHTIETLKLAVDGAIAKYKDWKPEYIKPDTIFNGEMEKRVEWGRRLKEKKNDRTHYYSGY